MSESVSIGAGVVVVVVAAAAAVGVMGVASYVYSNSPYKVHCIEE